MLHVALLAACHHLSYHGEPLGCFDWAKRSCFLNKFAPGNSDIPPWEKENHLQKCVARGHVRFREATPKTLQSDIRCFDKDGILSFKKNLSNTWVVVPPSYKLTPLVKRCFFPVSRCIHVPSPRTMELVFSCWFWFLTSIIKLDVSENSGFSPQIIHFNRVFHYFHHPFWGPTPIFGNTQLKSQQIGGMTFFWWNLLPHAPPTSKFLRNQGVGFTALLHQHGRKIPIFSIGNTSSNGGESPLPS